MYIEKGKACNCCREAGVMFIQTNKTKDWDSYSNQELWVAMKNDSRQALSKLFVRLYPELYRYGMSIVGLQEVVNDGIQQLFFRLWNKRKTLQLIDKSVKSYLFVSLRRILLREIEKEKARKERAFEFTERSYLPVTSPEENIFRQEAIEKQQNRFCEALHLLTSRQKEALMLRLKSGLSNQEIATVMNLSEKRVRNLIYEATKRLREAVHMNECPTE
ncbi:sigma-70 family RNA polymerase sigma factor [Aliifodinibius sp. S!AR15-10]|uniref:RNA polymerase sigma factor n=1 Tax=Aliifodinibius sp. S!AR15-10 TaxID=2950437 RepID=UPI00285AADFA|nr:sigma-70 family RNA polymerase sigma factor [Aliifodinibius sp. S!AR15-10]MDR8394079.1 sigma-70 family RNA polymerase sigma factor [Aliifodinibius sp. S!AR15-10]